MAVKVKPNGYEVDEAIDNIRLYNRYKLLALNMFKWENLPQGLTSRHIERVLYDYGQGVMYYTDATGYLFLPCSGVGTPNILGEDVFVQATGFGMTHTLKLYNTLDNTLNLTSETVGVRCLNNDLMIPSFINVVDYANKMNDVEKAIDRNLKQQRFPYMIFTNSNNEFSMKAMIKKVEAGEPVIYVDKKVSMDDFQFFNTGVPYIVDQLQDYKKELEQEILNFFGLSSTNNKRERMLVDELKLNNDYKDRTCELMFKERQEFAKMVNEFYGLNIKVVNLNETKKAGEENGEIHIDNPTDSR